MRKVLGLLTLCLALVAGSAGAITFMQEKVKDPINGQTLTFQSPGSWGSYIYSHPSKSDLVFFPYTYESFLWFNPETGFISLGSDFEKVHPSQAKQLKSWLAKNYDKRKPPKSRVEKLRWAERVYGQRGMDDDFWAHFYRLMALETSYKDKAASLSYVRKALSLLRKQLDQAKSDGARLETLYLLSEYSRRIGDENESQRYLQLLSAMKTDAKSEYTKTYMLKNIEQQRSPTRKVDFSK